MASAKEKRIVERLQQIKQIASEQNATATVGGVTGHQLAEEAAGLGLELADIQGKEV
jgi:hypothetical protein